MKKDIACQAAQIARPGVGEAAGRHIVKGVRRLLMVLVTLALCATPTVVHAADPVPVIKPAVLAGGYLGPTFHQLEGGAPAIQLTARNAHLVVQKTVLGLWLSQGSASFGDVLATKTVKLPLDLIGLLIPVPQKFRVVNARTGQQIGPAQPIVVFKKPVVDRSSRWSYLTSRIARFQCRNITYKVDVRDAPGSNATALAETKAAAAMVSKASGIKLVYGGTAKVDSSSTQRASADITVKYGKLSPTPASNVTAGKTWANWSGLRGTTALSKITSSKVVYRKSTKVSAAKNKAIMAHELMHALGLGHSESTADVMHAPVKVTTFGAGDLAGLKAVGPKAGCF